MQVIGIVGGIGAGKTTVVSILQDMLQAKVMNADEIGHSILLPEGKAYRQVIETFGAGILDQKGFIVRSELGKIVFSNHERLKKLNEITHPIICDEIRSTLKKHEEDGQIKWVIIDAPLLIEVGLKSVTNKVIGVYAKESLRIMRIQKRNQFTYDEALKRIKAQRKWEELQKDIDYVIDNSFSYEYTKEQIKKLITTW
jgi:dephospho-CoA kinase